MKKKVVRKQVVKKTQPIVQELSFRHKVSIKLIAFKARFNSFFYSLRAKVRGY